ncbi:MAG: FKBP-type peptidylprolyl isomerase [Deltaproteobacteria bacterium]|nr:MAG: FKBP-type peptidylprolyl isomerase [Deltaproteobacteria bacterium]
MSKIKKGSRVTVCYTAKLSNGEVFKTVDEKSPLVFQIGNTEAPPTIEEAVKEMEPGQQVKVVVPPEEGYGARQKSLLQTIERESFSQDIDPKPGMILSLKVEKDGKKHQVPATVMEVDEHSITVDYNHPLAGHHLTYELKLIAVED